jgi:hypothetical protein
MRSHEYIIPGFMFLKIKFPFLSDRVNLYKIESTGLIKQQPNYRPVHFDYYYYTYKDLLVEKS